MDFKSFNLNLVIRVLLLILTAFLLGLVFYLDQKLYTKILLIILIVIQAIFIVMYLNKMNRELVQFLEVLNYGGASYRFSSSLKGNFTRLAKILNNTSDLIINAKIEKEKQYQFLQFVIEQINIGLLAFNSYGQIQFVNSSLKSILQVNTLTYIDDLKEVNLELVNKIKTETPKLSFQFKIVINNQLMQLYVQKEQIRINNECINLVSFQNISAELDKKELESWQRLIRVLTHEIMNSITPITNLTYSIKRSLQEDSELSNSIGAVKDAIEDIEIIEKRSNNLMQFVENYRKLTRLGKINIKESNLVEPVQNALNIFKDDFNKKNILCRYNGSDKIIKNIDDKLIEHAFINILKNAIEADCSEIDVSIIEQLDSTHIIVKDNGKGISKEKLEDIFVPFYTSKEKGTGIGLSFVKQIVNMHSGSISVQSEEKKGTTISITL